MNMASDAASLAFHKVGGQPIYESDRINDYTAKKVCLYAMYMIFDSVLITPMI